MNGGIRKVDNTNVYEHLMMVEGGERSYMDTAAMAAGFTPIFPEDPEWQELIDQHLDEVAELSLEGLEVFGLAKDGKFVALCGYYLRSDDDMIVIGREVKLPYELFMMADEDEDSSMAMAHAAQLFIASREGLRIVMLAH